MSEDEPYFRRFELTIGVFLPRDAELPVTFNDWLERAGCQPIGSSSTTLERVVETQIPVARDMVERRGEHKNRSIYS